MKCDALQEALVDVARGRDVGAGTVGVVEAHIEHCAACRARYTREQQLSDALRALAKSTDARSASALVEMRLLAAFAEQHALVPGWRAQVWMRAAAAMVVVAASAFVWWRIVNVPGVENTQQASTQKPAPIEAKTPPQVQATETQGTRPEATPTVASKIPQPRTATSGRRSSGRVVRPEGFVELPSATGLPAFESGEIVRVEVPLTSLPMYGIDIAPDARGPAVEADFLVGQDGQARAIRLVKNSRLDSASAREQE